MLGQQVVCLVEEDGLTIFLVASGAERSGTFGDTLRKANEDQYVLESNSGTTS